MNLITHLQLSFLPLQHSFCLGNLHSFEAGHSLYTIIPYFYVFTFETLLGSQPQIGNMKTTIIIASLFAAALSAPTLPPSTRRQAGGNLQTFTAALGGMAATPVTNSGNADRPFQVKGDTFVNIAAALARSCDQQFNACANKANGGDATLSVSACSAQQSACSLES